VLDAFVGSGITLIAAKQTQRDGRGIDPHDCDVAPAICMKPAGLSSGHGAAFRNVKRRTG
jgi:hypothetical protein